MIRIFSLDYYFNGSIGNFSLFFNFLPSFKYDALWIHYYEVRNYFKLQLRRDLQILCSIFTVVAVLRCNHMCSIQWMSELIMNANWRCPPFSLEDKMCDWQRPWHLFFILLEAGKWLHGARYRRIYISGLLWMRMLSVSESRICLIVVFTERR